MDECVVELGDSMGWLPEFFGSPNNDGQGTRGAPRVWLSAKIRL
jgi:hypothetical protein